jgi:glycosyltransferase involved in cell wall biosynthesis
LTTGRLRVVLVTHYFSTHRGGVEQVAGQLATRLAKTGQFELTWVSSDSDPAPAAVDGLHYIAVPANNILERLGFPWPVWPPKSLKVLRSAIAEADIVHIHDFIYFGNLAAFVISCRSGKPVIITQHIGDIPYKNLLLRLSIWTINRIIGRLVLGKADQVAFISEAVRRHFSHFARFSRPSIHLPNGVDTEIFHPVVAGTREAIRLGLGMHSGQRVVLYVGRFVEKKGLLLLRQLATTMADLEWWFAGWGAPDSDAHPSNWKLPNARVFGDRSGGSLAELYSAADLLVLPSMSEGFPLVVQEAMACGTRALVTTAIAEGAPETGELLLTCPIDPPESALAAWQIAVNSALVGRDNAMRMRLADFAKTHWAWDRAVARYSELLLGLAKKPRTFVRTDPTKAHRRRE